MKHQWECEGKRQRVNSQSLSLCHAVEQHCFVSFHSALKSWRYPRPSDYGRTQTWNRDCAAMRPSTPLPCRPICIQQHTIRQGLKLRLQLPSSSCTEAVPPQRPACVELRPLLCCNRISICGLFLIKHKGWHMLMETRVFS